MLYQQSDFLPRSARSFGKTPVFSRTCRFRYRSLRGDKGVITRTRCLQQWVPAQVHTMQRHSCFKLLKNGVSQNSHEQNETSLFFSSHFMQRTRGSKKGSPQLTAHSKLVKHTARLLKICTALTFTCSGKSRKVQCFVWMKTQEFR